MSNALANWLTNAGFDTARYVADNADLARAGLPETEAIAHFLAHGYAENRSLTLQPLPAGLAACIAAAPPNTAQTRAICRKITRAQLALPASEAALWTGADTQLHAFLASAHARPYYVLGDSHAELYRRFPDTGQIWCAPLLLKCGAGSAAGLANPASRSGYGARILAWAARHAAGPHAQTPIFVKFGQVDAEFVWTFQRIRAGQTRYRQAAFIAFTRRTIDRYALFLRQLTSLTGPAPLRICGIYPPALSDAAWAQGYVNAHVGELEGDRSLDHLAAAIRTLDIPTLPTRTRLHAIFNTALAAACDALGLRFVDDFHPFLAADGRLNPAFTRGTDHHLEYESTRDVCENIILKELKEAVLF